MIHSISQRIPAYLTLQIFKDLMLDQEISLNLIKNIDQAHSLRNSINHFQIDLLQFLQVRRKLSFPNIQIQGEQHLVNQSTHPLPIVLYLAQAVILKWQIEITSSQIRIMLQPLEVIPL